MDITGSTLLRRSAAVAALFFLVAPPVRADDLLSLAEQLRGKYLAGLEEVAAWCQTKGLTDEAKQTRALAGRRDPYKIYLPVLPVEVGPPKLPDDASADKVEWDARLGRQRRDYANALYELARRAIRLRRASLAYDLVLEAIRANPDHEAVRRVMGYQQHRGGWYTPYEARKLRAGHVWHEKFGWLPKTYVRRYEDGQRQVNNRWISAEEDARMHRDIREGWDVETEHYTIRTNHSLQAGVALGAKLENLYRLWQQLFIRYYASESDVVALFDGRARSPRAEAPRLQIVYFRDRDDYNRTLRSLVPNIDISIGYYRADARAAYFFAGKDADDRTLYHEATHQLFHQSRRVAATVGRSANFWIIEGIAMYMESLHQEDGYDVLGGLQDERLHAARYRLLEDAFYVPLAEFSSFGMEKLQKDPRIARLYSQAAGLTHFLVYYDGGRYRDALVAYLDAVYSGRDKPDTLAKLTGTSFEELDKQYREFLQGMRPKAE